MQGDVRAREIRKVLWIVLGLNWIVAFLKIVTGVLTHSMVILSDGIHSLSDGASNIVGLVGISIASHPADKDHPYGHRKYETIAAFLISFTLFFAAVTIVKESVRQFFLPVEARVGPLSFGVMFITLVVNVFTAWWERRKGKALSSDLLTADSWHTFSDVFVTFSVFAALIGIQLGFGRIDTVASIAIAVFITRIALGILVRSTDVLGDKVVLDENEVRNLVMKIQGVGDCHEIRSRGRRDDIRVDLHILVDPAMSVEKSHTLANLIERDIRLNIKGVTDVLVHIEPLHHDHAELEGT